MQTLGLNKSGGQNNSINQPKTRFWKRQFQAQSTEVQRTFDWIFGVLLPVICFVFDPLVFKGNAWGTAVLGNYKPFAYLYKFCFNNGNGGVVDLGRKTQMAQRIFSRTIFPGRNYFTRCRHSFDSIQSARFNYSGRDFGFYAAVYFDRFPAKCLSRHANFKDVFGKKCFDLCGRFRCAFQRDSSVDDQ